LELLRDQLGLKSIHAACESSVCEACTVLVDGLAVRSCAYLAVQADGRTVVTLEGLERLAPEGSSGAVKAGRHPLQEALLKSEAFPCGQCAPGMVLAAKQAQDATTEVSSRELERILRDKSCRGVNPQRFLQALQEVAKQEPEKGSETGRRS
jgi:carbon-monoxide dehydrogenase small subunit